MHDELASCKLSIMAAFPVPARTTRCWRQLQTDARRLRSTRPAVTRAIAPSTEVIEYAASATTNPSDLFEVASLRARAYYEGDEGRFVESFVRQFEHAEWKSLQQRTALQLNGRSACRCLTVTANGDSGSIVGTADVLMPLAHSGRQPKSVPMNDRHGAYVLNVVVHPAWRRQGIGRTLMRAATQEASSCGARRLYTEVDVDNMGALLLYLSLGFKQQGEVTRNCTPTSSHGKRFVLMRELMH